MANTVTPEMAENAKNIYESLINWLDRDNWRYKRNDENHLIESGMGGDDLHMRFTIRVDEKREIISYYSELPFKVPGDKMVDMAIAVNAINNSLLNGYFEYDLAGSVCFKMSNAFAGCSGITDEVFAYLIFTATNTVDDYNDRLFMLTKGMISADDFLNE